jgi:RimJ/RimL family protein N-acetyltransferase
MARLKPQQIKLKNGTDVLLRSPNPEDAAYVLTSVKTIMQTSEHLLTEPDEFNYTVEQEAELIGSYLAHGDKLWIVAVVDKQVVGCLTFSVGSKRRISHQGDLGISLMPEFRGMGLGKLMMESLITWAEENPRVEQLRLRVHAKNIHAVRLYQRLGFKEEGREVRGAKMSDGSYDDVISMVRYV